MISNRSVPGTSFDEDESKFPFWKRCQIWFTEDWSALIGGIFTGYTDQNWTEFTLIQARAEVEWILSNAEINIALLGFHVRFTYFWPSKRRTEMMAQVDEFLLRHNLLDDDKK